MSEQVIKCGCGQMNTVSSWNRGDGWRCANCGSPLTRPVRKAAFPWRKWVTGTAFFIFAVMLKTFLKPDKPYRAPAPTTMVWPRIYVTMPGSTPARNRAPSERRLLPDSTVLFTSDFLGDRELFISNANSRDALVNLFDQRVGLAARSIYVKAGGSITIRNMPHDYFNIRYATGDDWDSGKARFMEIADCQESTVPLNFVRNTRRELTIPAHGDTTAKMRDYDKGKFFYY